MKGFTSCWNQYLDLIPDTYQDIYFREEYVRLYETEFEKACSFVYEDADSVFIYPFLRRDFMFHGVQCSDFETVYGYGGPISNNISKVFLTSALQAFVEHAKAENFICGFTRFHPLLKNWIYFDTIGNLIFDRKTIAIDLTNGIEATWKNEIHTKNRNVIKKGIKNGLEFLVDNTFSYLPAFKQLYNATMDKLEADGFYYFPDLYYQQLKDSLKDSFLGIVKFQDKVIAGAIFFYQYPYGHYHLAGSDKEYLSLSPNNFLLWNAAKELAARGLLYFHLGGGTDGSESNSLYQYKRKFSKHEYQFMLGKLVFNDSLYNEICAEWELSNPTKAQQMRNILLKYKY